MPETTIVSFILRFTQEAPTEERAPSQTWRGMLRHVQTNEQIYFVRLDEALEFIGRYVDLGSGEVLDIEEDV